MLDGYLNSVSGGNQERRLVRHRPPIELLKIPM